MIATLESTQVASPPSARDLEAFELVAVRNKSTREAAEMLGISQTRLRQVLSRVVEFLAQAVPGGDDERTPEERLRVAEHLASMRMDYLYSEALTMWRASRQPTPSCPVALGKVCFLNQAMRIAVASAKVPRHLLPALAEAPSALDCDERQPAIHPPAEDCSLEAASRPASPRPASVPVAVTDSPDETCRMLDEIRADARRTFLRPAQSAERQQVAIPECGDADRLLSRKERRFRERQLRRAAGR